MRLKPVFLAFLCLISFSAQSARAGLFEKKKEPVYQDFPLTRSVTNSGKITLPSRTGYIERVDEFIKNFNGSHRPEERLVAAVKVEKSPISPAPYRYQNERFIDQNISTISEMSANMHLAYLLEDMKKNGFIKDVNAESAKLVKVTKIVEKERSSVSDGMVFNVWVVLGAKAELSTAGQDYFSKR